MVQAVSDGTQIHQTLIRLIKGDITDLDIEAFVFYAENDLKLGAGFGNAIAVRGGPTIQKELDALAPVETGQAVISAGGDLKAEYVIHAVGPKFQEADTEAKLRTTMLNVLRLADERGITRIAFPAMGAGYYFVPNDVCARTVMDSLTTHLRGATGIREVVICVLDTPQFKAFEAALATRSEPREP